MISPGVQRVSYVVSLGLRGLIVSLRVQWVSWFPLGIGGGGAHGFRWSSVGLVVSIGFRSAHGFPWGSGGSWFPLGFRGAHGFPWGSESFIVFCWGSEGLMVSWFPLGCRGARGFPWDSEGLMIFPGVHRISRFPLGFRRHHGFPWG
jgi:hypothetical protein